MAYPDYMGVAGGAESRMKALINRVDDLERRQSMGMPYEQAAEEMGLDKSQNMAVPNPTINNGKMPVGGSQTPENFQNMVQLMELQMMNQAMGIGQDQNQQNNNQQYNPFAANPMTQMGMNPMMNGMPMPGMQGMTGLDHQMTGGMMLPGMQSTAMPMQGTSGTAMPGMGSIDPQLIQQMQQLNMMRGGF